MYELIQVGKNSYYIKSPTNLGIIQINEHEVCLIDSGNNKDAGRKIKKILEEKGWTLRAIYNTHSNADHIGGNKYLQEQTGCKIYSTPIDSIFSRYTILEPSFLYGGFPPKDLRNKFLMAPESNVEELNDENIANSLKVIELPGHFFHMIGFESEDNIIYLGDCLLSKEILEKYQIGFIYDIEKYLETLNKVKNMKATLFIPAHAEATTDIKDLAQLNIDKVHEIVSVILNICHFPISFEKILKNLFEFYHLQMDFNQYVLVGSTLRSFLSWLKDKGKLEATFINNELLWKTL